MALVKQYVNLPAGATSILGNVRALRVTPNNVPNVAPGDRVEWWIEPNAANTDIIYESLTERTRLANAQTVGVTTGGQHNFDNTLTFTHVGGDKYIIKASRLGNRPQSLSTDEFQTWRKLYYTLWYSGAVTLGTINNLDPRFKATFATSFLEMERVNVLATLTVVNDARVDYRSLGSAVNDWTFLNGGPNAYVALRAGGVPVAAGTLSDKPLHMAFLMVPSCYFTRLDRVVLPTLRAAGVVGTTPTFRTVWPDPNRSNDFLFTAQASWGGAGATDVRSYFTFVPGVPPATVPTQINWNLSTLPGLTTYLAASAANSFRLDFSFISRAAINGYSWGNFCVVGCTGPGRTETRVLGTYVHETGHGVGQVVRWENRYDRGTGAAIASDLNPRWYDDVFGGQGPHCNTNAALSATPALTSGQQYVWGGGARLCTMYHAGDINRDDGVFCPFCEPRIRRMNLNSVAQTARNWNYFG